MTEKLITPEQLAERWQVPIKTIYSLVDRKKLKALRLPGSRLLRFDPNNLEATSAEVLPFPKKKKGR